MYLLISINKNELFHKYKHFHKKYILKLFWNHLILSGAPKGPQQHWNWGFAWAKPPTTTQQIPGRLKPTGASPLKDFKGLPSSHRRILKKRSLNSKNGKELSAGRHPAAQPDNPEQRPTPRTSYFLKGSPPGVPLEAPWGLEKPVSLKGGDPRTQKFYQSYFLKCAHFYHQQSLSIITNWIIDLVTLLFFFVLLILLTPQILILKTFCIESLLSLSETTKCFFLIFFLDLLVGFHSSKSWEIFLQFFIEHFGLQIHPNFIAFFISTFPVLLDTIFKYWIFRYLNKISPSTVATYQAMIE